MAAPIYAKPNDAPTDDQVSYWSGELGRAKKQYQTFWENGNQVVDAYRLQKNDGNDLNAKDKYNILYSSTETIRPNLYAQTPKPRVVLRSKDTASETVRIAAQLLEGCVEYIIDEEDFDELMNATVEDYMLPGIGQAFVRYEASFEDKLDDDGEPLYEEDGKTPQQKLLDEMVKIEYVYWEDFLTGVARTWKDVPWVAKRIWLSKKDATKRFGKDKANKLTYALRDTSARQQDNPSETAEAWEIWDKPTRTVYWYGEGLTELLDSKEDPLKLKRFFPCPRPMRAIANTRTMVPRALYSQYKSQAETLNVMTRRIRLLSEALRVVGLYDGAQANMADLLNPQAGNKMIAVSNWAMFAQSGGLKNAVDWLPIDTVVKVLNELLAAREVCKQEIYEITGFSDVVRGVSKASETLGAQNLKANWAGARVKKMQQEVQRFARDLLALAGELIAEHCEPASIARFAGIELPDPKAVAADPNLQAKVQTFKDATGLLHSELRRVSSIDIETDSTLLADETAEREDRTKFLAAAGAFLQQSVPAMEATPELGPLLGAMLMFVVRTFPSSRPIEEEFEKVQQGMASRAQNQDQDKDGKKAEAAQKAQADQAAAALKGQELQVRAQNDQAKAQNDATAETNRHSERMAELELKQREVAIRERELAMAEQKLELDAQDVQTRAFAAQAAAAAEVASLGQEVVQAQREEAQEYDAMDREDAHRDADRQAQADQAEAAQEAAAEPPEGA